MCTGGRGGGLVGGGGYQTKTELNTMSMINKTTDIYNTI